MADALFQSLLQRTQDALPDFHAPPPMKYLAHHDRDETNERIFIIACADARVDPANILQLQPREASVIRNAGGRVTDDTFRSLEIMGSLVNLGIIAVIHHTVRTDCGGLFTTDEEVARRVGARNPEHAHRIQGKNYATFKDIGLDESIRVDVAKVRAWPFLPKETRVVGYVYETEKGTLREVEVSA